MTTNLILKKQRNNWSVNLEKLSIHVNLAEVKSEALVGSLKKCVSQVT